LTLLSLTAETEIGLLKWELIIKMKLNFFAIMPDYGYITNFGKAHLKDLVALQV
jgi:UDP-N-acetylmuramoyl-tripeptide--D-alanyl-D-alanine ligase